MKNKRTIDQKYKDIEKRDKKIEKTLVDIMDAWADFKLEINKIERKQKQKDIAVYSICGAGIFVCFVLLIITIFN